MLYYVAILYHISCLAKGRAKQDPCLILIPSLAFGKESGYAMKS